MRVFGAYLLLDLLVGLLIIGIAIQATTRFRRQRAHEVDEIPPGYERTEEVNIDPTTGVRMVVWYNAKTGQRLYVPEKREPRRH